MLRTILAGLDGTADSQSVLDLGIHLARRFDALLVGLAVIDEPGLHGPEEWILGETNYDRELNRKRLQELTVKTDQILGAAAVRCANEGVAFKPLEAVGDPYVEIPRQSHRFDLILLGRETHFQYGFERQTDDTLTRILRSSARPVVVGPRALCLGGSVVVAFDGSLQASRALFAFTTLGLGRDLVSRVISIHPEHRIAAALADMAVQFLVAHDVKAALTAVATSGSPARPILDLTRELNAGMVVMGVCGQPFIRELVLGSVTKTMLQETAVPLFVSH